MPDSAPGVGILKKTKFLPLESLHSLEEEMDNETNLLKVVINAKKERNRMMQQKITE